MQTTLIFRRRQIASCDTIAQFNQRTEGAQRTLLMVSNIGLRYGDRKLFDDVNIKFTPGNCYGLIGANGAGKSTFLKILAGEIEAQTGEVVITQGERLAVLQQDHFQYQTFTVCRR